MQEKDTLIFRRTKIQLITRFLSKIAQESSEDTSKDDSGDVYIKNTDDIPDEKIPKESPLRHGGKPEGEKPSESDKRVIKYKPTTILDFFKTGGNDPKEDKEHDNAHQEDKEEESERTRTKDNIREDTETLLNESLCDAFQDAWGDSPAVLDDRQEEAQDPETDNSHTEESHEISERTSPPPMVSQPVPSESPEIPDETSPAVTPDNSVPSELTPVEKPPPQPKHSQKKAAPNNVTNSPTLWVKETSLHDTPENADEDPDVTMDSITSEDLEETMDYISTKNRQSEEAEMEESVRIMTKRAPSKMTPKIVKIKLRFPKRIPKVRERNQTLMTEFLNAKDDSLRTGTLNHHPTEIDDSLPPAHLRTEPDTHTETFTKFDAENPTGLTTGSRAVPNIDEMTTFANDDDITSASKNPGTTVLAIVTEGPDSTRNS